MRELAASIEALTIQLRVHFLLQCGLQQSSNSNQLQLVEIYQTDCFPSLRGELR